MKLLSKLFVLCLITLLIVSAAHADRERLNRFVDLVVSGEASLGNGSLAAPSLTFSSDPDTGFYRKGTNQPGISAGGVLVGFGFNDAGNGTWAVNAGTAAYPGLSFDGNTNTGLYRAASNTLGVSAGGSLVATFDADGLYIRQNNKALRMEDQSGNAHDVLLINTAGDTTVKSPSGENLRLGANGFELAYTGSTFVPIVNDSATLGSSSQAWGDLFLVSPDGSVSQCGVDNSDNFTCTGL